MESEESKNLISVGDQLESVAWERLYRLEIQKFSPPVALAPEAGPTPPVSRFARSGRPSPLSRRPAPSRDRDPSWSRLALVYDVHDRTAEQLKEDVLGLLEGEIGRFRIFVFYWEGGMVMPRTGRLMGKGQDFLYSDNPRGDIVSVAEDPIEFEIENDEH